ncbi:hypothetical protein JTB14_037481 [Gonioctena quinquepunctata]|nr:hypothetical protein JTB14_037481 [Gonioctena quinquepunctata]
MRNVENTKRKLDKREKVHQDEAQKKGATVKQQHSKSESPTKNTTPASSSGEFSSYYHIQEKIIQIKEEILIKAERETELTINRDIILNVNSDKMNIESINKAIRNEIHNQNMGKFTREREKKKLKDSKEF